ncbi:MAG: c-type cytochrome, partial [Polyangiaceae bacterium]|nr:c-type cytochrome [Polyangiaceae bacterium]
VADPDGESIVSVDVDGKKQLGVLPLGAAAAQLLVLPDGRLLATLPAADRVAVVRVSDAGALTMTCTRATSAEPFGLATSARGDRIYVSAGWGARLEGFDGELGNKGGVDLPRDPRQIVLSDDEKTAFVSHAVGGIVSVVDLGTMRSSTPVLVWADPRDQDDPAGPRSLAAAMTSAVGKGSQPVAGQNGMRTGLQGYALVKSSDPPGRLLLPQVLVDPGNPEGRAEEFGNSGGVHLPNIAVIDAATKTPLSASLSTNQNMAIFFEDDSRFSGVQPTAAGCMLPRGAAFDAESGSLLVACLGSDMVVAYDGASATPTAVEMKRWDVGSGPTGVAVDAPKRRAIAWSQFERSLDVLPFSDLGVVIEPDGRPRRDKIDLSPLQKPPALAFLLGRQIFHGVADIRISSEGVACASCHPEGRDDGLTWATPEGPRRTPMLAGRMEPPLGWLGANEDLERHLDAEFLRLHGQGLRSVQREALMAYLSGLRPPPKRKTDAALAEKGKELFSSKGCATCHPGGGTDGKTHDVGSKRSGDKKAAFDTPSLRHLAGRAPYFHDGRFKSVREVLEQPHGDKTSTPKIAPNEIAPLEAYLLGL